MRKIFTHFKKKDPVLFAYIAKVGKLKKLQQDKPNNFFYRLCYEIIGQQLSDKSSSAIFGRFKKLLPKGEVRPADVLALTHEKLRATGMSHAKANYVYNLAKAVVNKQLNFAQFPALSNEQVIAQLVQVKGIGPWTAEMFLMFTLAREDMFSYGDLGLKNAIKKIYGIKDYINNKKIAKIVDNWSPYKTYACLILWASLEL